MMTPRIRVECLKLAVQMCCTARAFERHDDVLKLAQRFESYCAGEPSAIELGAAARASGEPALVKPRLGLPKR